MTGRTVKAFLIPSSSSRLYIASIDLSTSVTTHDLTIRLPKEIPKSAQNIPQIVGSSPLADEVRTVKVRQCRSHVNYHAEAEVN